MPVPNFDVMLAIELAFEPAAIQVLTDGGFDVLSAFALPGKVPALKDQQAIVALDVSSDEGDRFVFQTAADRSQSVPAGWRARLRVTHYVAADDRPVAVGADPVCYKRLLLQRGRVRALFMAPDWKLQALLPQYDFLSIALAAPDRRADQDRSAISATEDFDIRFTATDDLAAQP